MNSSSCMACGEHLTPFLNASTNFDYHMFQNDLILTASLLLGKSDISGTSGTKACFLQYRQLVRNNFSAARRAWMIHVQIDSIHLILSTDYCVDTARALFLLSIFFTWWSFGIIIGPRFSYDKYSVSCSLSFIRNTLCGLMMGEYFRIILYFGRNPVDIIDLYNLTWKTSTGSSNPFVPGFCDLSPVEKTEYLSLCSYQTSQRWKHFHIWT